MTQAPQQSYKNYMNSPGHRFKNYNALWQVKVEEMRLRVLREVDVLGNIMAIASGSPIPGVPTPTPEQVLYCNFVLLKKIMGDAPQALPSAPDPEAVDVMTEQTRQAAQSVLDKLNSAALAKATTIEATATVVPAKV
jgi:hypothetical protein